MIRKLLDLLFHRKAPWYERHFIWLVLGGAVVAMAICLAIGLQQSVWFDEAYSIMLAKQPIGDLLHLTSIDTHPPLYYLLLKFWAGLFGWSEVALRSLSVLAMGGAVVLGGVFARRFFGVRAALSTLPFIVFAPFLLRYGFEIRMYSLASLIGIAATYVLALAVDVKKPSAQVQLYILYAVLVALGVYTLYYAVLLWLVHVIWLVWLARYRKESIFKQRWWFALLGSVVLFLPWLPTFLKQMTNGALAPISQAMTVDNLVGVVSFQFLYQPSWQLSGLMSLLIVAVMAALVYAVVRALKNVPKTQKPQYVLVLFYALLPVLLIALISLARPMYVERYLAHVLIGMSILVGISIWILTQTPPRKGLGLGGLLLAVTLLGVGTLAQVGNYNFQRLQKPQISQATSDITCTDGSKIVAADPYVAIELSYYLQQHCPVYFYSDTADLRGGYAPLAQSPLRIGDPANELKNSKLTVVYYDELKMQLPSTLRQTEQWSYGPLHVASYGVE